MAPNRIEWVYKFVVDDPRLHSKGFTVYKFTSVVFPKSSPEAGTQLVIWKRFNDFKILQKLLKKFCKQHNLTSPPVLHKGSYFRRFDEAVIAQRLKSCQKLLDFVAGNRLIFLSEEFVQFCKKGYKLVPMGQGESTHCERGDPEIDDTRWRWFDDTRWSSQSSDDESGPASSVSTPSSVSPRHENPPPDDDALEAIAGCGGLQQKNLLGDTEVVCRSEHPVSPRDVWVEFSAPKRLPSPEERLSSYRVVGILNTRILIVHHSCRPDVNLALKVYRKSCWPSQQPNGDPRPVPNMVRLIDWIETEDAVFVITEFIRSLLLVDYVKRVTKSGTGNWSTPGFIPRFGDMENCNETEYKDLNGEELRVGIGTDVDALVQQSQRLLASVSRTLERSAAQQHQLKSAENVLERKPRSKSVLSRPRLERHLSLDDMSGIRPRTAYPSLDRAAPRKVPENLVRDWAATIVACMDSLHRCGIIWKDFHSGNVFVNDNGAAIVTHHFLWKGVESRVHTAVVAPEVWGVFPVTPAADWWSLGVLLYQLLTGMELSQTHPLGIGSHTTLDLPEGITAEARSLLTGLLQYDVAERLGLDDIKRHPFFNTVDWDAAYMDY